jgi:GntR family transcriptional repressor for pyruvate dehydrogenase complex
MIRGVGNRDLHIEPASRQNLAQTVANQLLGLIESGSLREGDRLPSESELKDRFGVGRSTIREALNGLVLLGAVDVRHGQGAVVVGRPVADSGLEAALRTARDADLIEVRRALETAIAEAAAARATDDDLAEVRALLDEAERHLAEEGSAIGESVGFHLRLAEATGNPFFIRFIEFSGELMRERGERLRSAEGYAEWELRMHRRLYDAVAARDPGRARSEMERHLEDAREIILDGWDAFRKRHTLT